MKILLAGSGVLADGVMEFLLQLEWTELVGVIGAGRGTPVSRRSKRAGIKLLQPAKTTMTAADILVAAEDPAPHHHTWAQTTRLGGLHVHLSLLPRHRGIDPVRWAVLDGDEHAGVTVHYVTDTDWEGNVLAQEKVEIKDSVTATELEEALRGTAREMIVKVLHALDKIGALPGTPQKGEPERWHDSVPDDAEADLDFDLPMAGLHRKIQTFCQPHRGARAQLDGRPLAIWRAQPLLPEPLPKSSAELVTGLDFSGADEPGAVLVGPDGRRALRCMCGGTLELLEVQPDPDGDGELANDTAKLADLLPDTGRVAAP